MKRVLIDFPSCPDMRYAVSKQLPGYLIVNINGPVGKVAEVILLGELTEKVVEWVRSQYSPAKTYQRGGH